MIFSPPYSVKEIHSQCKNCKTRQELIKTKEKPKENDVKTTPFFKKTNPERLAFLIP